MKSNLGNIAPVPQTETDLAYVQISDSLMMGGDADAKWVDDYYAAVYENMPGYKKPEHYMELPLWIPVVSGMAGDNYNETVHIVSDVDASIAELEETPGTLLFSTIESNAPQTKKIVEALSQPASKRREAKHLRKYRCSIRRHQSERIGGKKPDYECLTD